VTTPKIAQALATRIHFNTFAGNPVVCAQGKAVTGGDAIAKAAGELADRREIICWRSFRKLAEKHSLIGDVRGKGPDARGRTGEDRATKEPRRRRRWQIFETARTSVCSSQGRIPGNVLRIKPPMCFTKAERGFLLQVIDVASPNCENKTRHASLRKARAFA